MATVLEPGTQDARELFLLKLGEIVLKGLNRKVFEDRLVANVARRIRPFGRFQVSIRQSTIYVEPLDGECDLAGACDACCQVFGVATVVRALPCGKRVEDIAAAAEKYLGGALRAAGSFKVESRRADKTFPMTSIQLSQAVGGELAQAFPEVAVDVHNPGVTVYVEIRERAAYIHAPARAGAGGLPVGMGGRAVSLLSGGIDSPVSSWMMARRGVELEMVHFESPPYTSRQAQEKVLTLASRLTPWCGRLTVHIVPFTRIQEEIRKKCPEDYFTLIMRRFMMRLAQGVARYVRARALVTGESLGQVASQTLPALGVTEAVVDMPVLRPLIGMDKVEIIRLARRIGTYDTSILPYEDCCTVFTPRHPCTRPRLDEVEAAEAVLDADALVQEALSGVKRVRIKSDGTFAEPASGDENGAEEERI